MITWEYCRLVWSIRQVSAADQQAREALSRIRQRLLDKGLIYATEEYGHVDFTIPRFDEFMHRYMPYRTPRRKRGN